MAKYTLPNGKKVTVIPITVLDPFNPGVIKNLFLAKSDGLISIARETEIQAYSDMVSVISAQEES